MHGVWLVCFADGCFQTRLILAILQITCFVVSHIQFTEGTYVECIWYANGFAVDMIAVIYYQSQMDLSHSFTYILQCYTGEFPSQRPVTRSFDVFCAWINSWVNNREAGYFSCHRAHYDVMVIITKHAITRMVRILHGMYCDHNEPHT